MLLRFLLLILTALLVACGSTSSPQHSSQSPAPVANRGEAPAATSPAGKPAPVYQPGKQASRDPNLPPPAKDGGYYLDDGPADQIPDNLAATPDAVPQNEPLHKFANRPYNVLGRTWVPDTQGKAYAEEGRASWYGRKFHGKRTSSGETYDMFQMSGAHRTLPIPSYARVTNLENGRSVIVRINDRGPFHIERLIDLSYAAAFKLGYVSKGSARVKVERVFPGDDKPASPTVLAQQPATPVVETPQTPASTAQPEPSGFYLQLGSFSLKANAEVLRDKLTGVLAEHGKPVQVVQRNGLYRVWVGSYDSDASAREAIPVVQQLAGITPLPVH